MSANPKITEIARELALLKPDEAKAAMRQYDLRVIEECDPGPYSTPLGGYREMEIPVPPILVEPRIVVRGGITATIGRAGKGKTVMNLNRLLSWSAGRNYFPETDVMKPVEPLRVLVVENEGAAGLFHEQINLMYRSRGFTEDELALADQNFHIWGDGGYSGLKLDKPEGASQLKFEIDRVKPDIVFIEPFRFLWTGEENSATEMSVVLDELSSIAADFEIGIMVSHHERKGGVGDDGEKMSLARGSSVMEGAVGVMENFSEAKGGALRDLHWSKSRYGEPPDDVRMEWDYDTFWYTYVPPAAATAEIIDALAKTDGKALTVKDIVAITGESQKKVWLELKKLLADGDVKRSMVPGTGHVYRLPNDYGDKVDPEPDVKSLDF